MPNTRSATLSVRLKPGTKKRLAKLAQASGRSSNFFISDAVESYLSDQEQQLQSYVAVDKPLAAERLAIRIVAAVETLRNYPHLGRTGAEPGTRELVIGRTPFIVVYR